MPEDTFTTRSSQGWLSRIGSSFIAALLGIVLIPGSVIGLFWNEGRSVQTTKSLDEGANAVVEVPIAAVDARNAGKLVHFTGPLELHGEATDPQFGVSVPAVQLVRVVRMYQWTEEKKTETRDKLGGGQESVTTYTYRTEWDDDYHDSSRFAESGHVNPPKPFENETWVVPGADVGAFELQPNVLGKLEGSRQIDVPAEMMANALSVAGPQASISGRDIYVGRGTPSSPSVGDVRISFEAVTAEQVSVIGAQQGTSVGEYQTDAGDRLLMIAKGAQTSDAMFAEAHKDNRILTWILRGVGVLVMFVGFVMLLGPFPTLASVVPILGKAAGFGVMLISLVLTAILGTTTIAIAWFFYRPLLSIGLLAVVGAAIAGLVYLRKRKTESKPPPPGNPMWGARASV